MSESARTVTLDYARARAVLLSSVAEIGAERSGIVNAFRRTLAENVLAGADVPEHDSAAVGGYAVIADETLGCSEKEPVRLSMLAETPSKGLAIQAGTAVFVSEGDPLPQGADAVVESAYAYRAPGDVEVLIRAEVEPGDGVSGAGSLVRRGEMVLPKGSVVTGPEMGLLASIGRHGIAVSRGPRVSIITTGAGVVELVEKPMAGESRNSARYALVGMLMESGCDLDHLVHVTDGRLGLEKAISHCATSDAIIIALGPGDKHDMAVAALRNSGDVYFERVHAEPGAAPAIGMVEKRPVFVTSASAILVAFEALIRPGLLTILGRAMIDRQSVKASADCVLRFNPGYRHFLEAVTHYTGDSFSTKPTNAHAQLPNSLIVIPEDVENVRRGEMVEVWLL